MNSSRYVPQSRCSSFAMEDGLYIVLQVPFITIQFGCGFVCSFFLNSVFSVHSCLFFCNQVAEEMRVDLGL